MNGRPPFATVPDNLVIAEAELLTRYVDLETPEVKAVFRWFNYLLSIDDRKWEIKVVVPETWQVLGEVKQPTMLAVWSAVEWTFSIPLTLPEGDLPPLAKVFLIVDASSGESEQMAYEIGLVVLDPPAPPDDAPSIETSYALDDQIMLYGYTLSNETPVPGEQLTLDLYWEALAPSENLTVFVHLLDENGNLVTQIDAPPHAIYPTGVWETGTRLMSRYTLNLPGNIASGKYRLGVGLYAQDVSDRLQVSEGSDDIIDISSIVVVAN